MWHWCTGPDWCVSVLRLIITGAVLRRHSYKTSRCLGNYWWLRGRSNAALNPQAVYAVDSVHIDTVSVVLFSSSRWVSVIANDRYCCVVVVVASSSSSSILCLQNAPILASCVFDKHGLISIIFSKRHQYTFKTDVHVQLSFSLHFLTIATNDA